MITVRTVYKDGPLSTGVFVLNKKSPIYPQFNLLLSIFFNREDRYYHQLVNDLFEDAKDDLWRGAISDIRRLSSKTGVTFLRDDEKRDGVVAPWMLKALNRVFSRYAAEIDTLCKYMILDPKEPISLNGYWSKVKALEASEKVEQTNKIGRGTLTPYVAILDDFPYYLKRPQSVRSVTPKSTTRRTNTPVEPTSTEYPHPVSNFQSSFNPAEIILRGISSSDVGERTFYTGDRYVPEAAPLDITSCRSSNSYDHSPSSDYSCSSSDSGGSDGGGSSD